VTLSRGSALAVGLALAFAAGGCASVQVAVNRNADIQSVKRVAVLPFAVRDEGQSVWLEGAWETEMMRLGYVVVERGDVQDILREQGLSLAGITREDQAPRIGMILGVEGLLLGSGTPERPTVRLVSLATGQTLWSVAYHDESYLASPRKMADGVEGELRAAAWRPAVVVRDSSTSRARLFGSGSGRRVAVNTFKGSDPEEWADRAGTAFLQAGADIVERARLEELLKEHALSLSGVVSEAGAVKLTQVLGADSVLMGGGFGRPYRRTAGTMMGAGVSGYKFALKLVSLETGQLKWSGYGMIADPDDRETFTAIFLATAGSAR